MVPNNQMQLHFFIQYYLVIIEIVLITSIVKQKCYNVVNTVLIVS